MAWPLWTAPPGCGERDQGNLGEARWAWPKQGGASDVPGGRGFVVWGGVRWGVVCGRGLVGRDLGVWGGALAKRAESRTVHSSRPGPWMSPSLVGS